VEGIRSRACRFLPFRMTSFWEVEATDRGITKILKETNEHEKFVWDRFVEKILQKARENRPLDDPYV
jgi:hypothetical protein